MKIVLLAPLPPPAGGIASWTKMMLSSEIAKEHEILIVNTAVKGKRAKQIIKWSVLNEIKRNSRIIRDMKEALKISKPDIVHVNTSCAKRGLIRDYYLAILAKRHHAKVLLHCHCDVSYQVRSRLSKLFYKKIANISDAIIVLNTPSKEFTQKLAKKDCIILPHFVSKENMVLLKEKKNIKDDVTNVIYVGHVTKAKGCDLILQAAKSFPKVMFNLYGYISDKIADLPRPANVHLKGEVSPEEINKAFSESDLFLFPTLTEGFPMALLEAMAHGLPCISTKVGAIPDMLEGQGGILLEPGKTDDFVTALNALDKNVEQRTKMSTWNKEKIRNNYVDKIVLQRLINIYRQILDLL